MAPFLILIAKPFLGPWDVSAIYWMECSEIDIARSARARRTRPSLSEIGRDRCGLGRGIADPARRRQAKFCLHPPQNVGHLDGRPFSIPGCLDPASCQRTGYAAKRSYAARPYLLDHWQHVCRKLIGGLSVARRCPRARLRQPRVAPDAARLLSRPLKRPWCFGIGAAHFGASLLCCEHPIYAGAFDIAALLPGGGLGRKGALASMRRPRH